MSPALDTLRSISHRSNVGTQCARIFGSSSSIRAPHDDEGAFAKSVRAKANTLLVLASAFFVLVGAGILRPHLGMSSMMGEFKVSSLVELGRARR